MNRLLAVLKWLVASLATLGLFAGQSLAFVHQRTGTRPDPDRAPSKVRTLARVPRNRMSPSVPVVANPYVAPLLEATADGLDKQKATLFRMKSLARTASNGTLTTIERTFLNQLFQANRALIDNVARTARFGDLALLSGQQDVLLEGPPPVILVFLDLPDATQNGLSLNASPFDLTTITNATAAFVPLTAALGTLAEYRADLRSAWIQLQY